MIGEKYVKDSRAIFDNILRENKITYEERNRIDDPEGHFYFTVSLAGAFYLAYVQSSYPDYVLNELFDEIQKEGLHLLIDDKGEINKCARDKLRQLFEHYKNPKSSVAAAQLQMNQVKLEMRNNMHNLINNLEDTRALDEKSKKIQQSTLIYSNDARVLEKETWCRKFKWTLIIVVLVIGLALIIVLPLVLSKTHVSNGTTAS